jgi:hypothetical protein
VSHNNTEFANTACGKFVFTFGDALSFFLEIELVGTTERKKLIEKMPHFDKSEFISNCIDHNQHEGRRLPIERDKMGGRLATTQLRDYNLSV